MSKSILCASWAFVLAALTTGSPAGAQEAIPREYGYKLAARTAEATYFMSGFKRGAEPESVEAWVWTVPAAASDIDGEPYDAKAQWTVLRCTANSIEMLKTEFYRKGELVKSVDVAVGVATEIKSWSPMAPIWKTACSSSVRYEARHVDTLDQVYDIAQGKHATAELKAD